MDSDNIVPNALGYSMLEHSDQIEEAYKLIQQAFSLNPDDPAPSTAWVGHYLARTATGCSGLLEGNGTYA